MADERRRATSDWPKDGVGSKSPGSAGSGQQALMRLCAGGPRQWDGHQDGCCWPVVVDREAFARCLESRGYSQVRQW